MALCLAFPPAANRERRERYGELIDIMKALKEREKKERKIIEERRKERSKEEVQKCDHNIVKRHLELEGKRRDVETETSVKGSSNLSSEVATASSYDNNETTTRKRQLSISEEIEYKCLLLEELFPPQLLDPAALPPVNLDWLYPDTTKKTKTSKEDDERRAEKRQRSESILSNCSSSWTGPHAQYLHEVDLYALPYVLPF